MEETTDLVLADPNEMARIGLRTLLCRSQGLRVVAEADGGYKAIDLCRSLKPQVALLAHSLQHPSIEATVRRLRRYCPQTAALILAVSGEAGEMERLLGAGAAGYVQTAEAEATLIQAIRAVAQGQVWLSRSAVARLGERPDRRRRDPGGLTPRELQALKMLLKYPGATEIASALHLSVQTVANYLSRAYGKLGIAGKEDARVWLKSQGVEE